MICNRILLINCTLDMESRKKIKEAVSSPNLGLLSIASVLIMHGYQVKVIDFFVEELSGADFIHALEKFNPSVIGFSVYTRTAPFLKKIVKILKDTGYQGVLTAGGPHASFCQKELIEEYGIDYVISGEGEFTFLKLMEHLRYKEYPIEKIKGLSYRTNVGIKINTKNDYIEHLDALPLQPAGLIDYNRYSAPFTLTTSRGCPGNCIYCASRTMAGRKYRMRSPENIICEVEYLFRKLNRKKILILDDTFTADSSRFFSFADLIKKHRIDFEYRIESRGDVLSEEVLQELKESNCKVVHVGIESGSQRVIDKIAKNINLEKTTYLVKKGREIGIHMVASFIIGHYCDTLDTIMETLSLMEELNQIGIEVSVASCTPFPGTPLYENRDKLGIKIHAKSWQGFDFGNVIISTRYMEQEQLRKCLYKAVEICM